MKKILVIISVCSGLAAPAVAGVPFWQPPMTSSLTPWSTGYMSGKLMVYPSTQTAAASPAISLNGLTGAVTANSFFGNGENLTGVIPSSATGYYPMWVATATYALNGGGGGVAESTAVVDALPIGSIVQYSSTTPPDGYLYCDGSWYSTTTYASLFAITGYRYSTYTVTGAQFQVPDFRGMFARGYDGGAARDAEPYRVLGSTQTDAMQGHWHDINFYTTPGGASNDLQYITASKGSLTSDPTNIEIASPITDGTNGTPRTASETRPKNIAVAYMIKYAHVGTVAISSTSLISASSMTWTSPATFTSSATFGNAVTMSSFSATGYAAFSATTATTTFSGWVDIGVETVVATITTNGRVACPNGKRILYGGCQAGIGGMAITLSIGSTENTTSTTVSGTRADSGQTAYSWTCGASTVGSIFGQAVCARIK